MQFDIDCLQLKIMRLDYFHTQNLIIDNFSEFDGTFASIIDVFGEGNYEYLFQPEMDIYLLKFYIFDNYPQENF